LSSTPDNRRRAAAARPIAERRISEKRFPLVLK